MGMEDYDFNGNENLIPQSKIDGSLFKVLRLSTLWNKCHRDLESGNATRLNILLDSIYLELIADCTEEQIKIINDLNLRIKKARTKKNIAIMWEAIKEKWAELFRIEKSQGLGKRYRSIDEDELD
jgi:hypothetical protein